MAQVFAAGGARVAQQFGIAFDLLQEGVDRAIEERARDLSGQITDTTYQQIRDALIDGVVAGDDIDTLADRVRTVFATASERRAVTIARTEVISAYNGAQTMAARALPRDVVAGMEWISTRDGRTRSAHRGQFPAGPDGQVQPIDGAFSVGGEHLKYPGDPVGSASNTINCRCTVVFLDPDEFGTRYQQQITPNSPAAPPTAKPKATAPAPTPAAPDEEPPEEPDQIAPSSLLAPLEKRKAKDGVGLGPNGTEVTGGRLRKAVDNAQAQIDNLLTAPKWMRDKLPSVYGDEDSAYRDKDGRPRLPVRSGGAGGSANGAFFRLGGKADRSVSIHLKATGDTPGLTFTHEFGHFFDHGDLRPKLGPGMATGDPTPELRKVLDALHASKAAQTFRGMRDNLNDEGNWESPTGHLFGPPSKSQLDRYWLTNEELWARAFAQWVATRSKDPALLRELNAMRQHGWPGQWDDDDFAAIGSAMDDLFRVLGVLR